LHQPILTDADRGALVEDGCGLTERVVALRPCEFVPRCGSRLECSGTPLGTFAGLDFVGESSERLRIGPGDHEGLPVHAGYRVAAGSAKLWQDLVGYPATEALSV